MNKIELLTNSISECETEKSAAFRELVILAFQELANNIERIDTVVDGISDDNFRTFARVEKLEKESKNIDNEFERIDIAIHNANARINQLINKLNEKRGIIVGLDMYLTARRYLCDYKGEQEEIQAVAKTLGIERFIEAKDEHDYLKSITIEFNAITWRKANAIHGWFVKNIQDDEDECEEHYVPREKLIELRHLCQLALENKGKIVDGLEPTNGFFFGSIERDEFYFADLQHTIDGINKALTLPENLYTFYYQSSW